MKLQLLVTVDVELNGTPHEVIEENLMGIIAHANSDGLITGTTEAELTSLHYGVRQADNYDDGLFKIVVDGLREYYPLLLNDKAELDRIRAAVAIPNTGDPQGDYQNLRNQVEVLCD
jgi:hypothetical protein